MSASSPLALVGKEHPAFVHLPIGAVLFLPFVIGVALRSMTRLRADGWWRAGGLLAAFGLLGGLVAMGSGLLWARDMGVLAPGVWMAQPLKPGPSFLALLRTHQLLALGGIPVGAACCLFLRLALQGRAQAGRAAFAASLVWLTLWGAAGHWGGRMVFPEAPQEEVLP